MEVLNRENIWGKFVCSVLFRNFASKERALEGCRQRGSLGVGVGAWDVFFASSHKMHGEAFLHWMDHIWLNKLLPDGDVDYVM